MRNMLDKEIKLIFNNNNRNHNCKKLINGIIIILKVQISIVMEKKLFYY
jgi:hypothetical protein